ncbi:aspartyl/asparaginyl beta-hydroxylase [Lutibacter oceani]|uniref:Aspartyl/asparaginyl beta-hydroxylase n=1 Tax=Lutibacter oceani TaxID=1853311 RepID=A0A3D9RKA9_9FLAO|nr:aspartyl/asparaginyl beta-hydroxylase domain-containing protein [Lutibacter oceani]REE79968.1 aspartyl/asparaginyl beta-hydroxylase [Lutibacter oceani]
MKKLENKTTTFSDRIQLPFFFETNKMLEEIEALKLKNFIYYDVLPLRSPAYMVDKSLPIPPPAEDYADGSWTDWLDTNELKQSKYLSSVVDFFREHCTVTLVRLLRLEPGAVVAEHKDPTLGIEIPKSVIRLTIPVLLNNAVVFYLNNKPVPMKTGECWYLRLSDPHKIINSGTTERINMTIDLIPNDWIKSFLINK